MAAASGELSATESEECLYTRDCEAALNGINMFLNNKFTEAQELFDSQKNESPLMHAGSSFVTFMTALMSYEEDKLSIAMKALQETEKKCEINDGFFSSIKKKLSKKNKSEEVAVVLSLEDKLQRQIIIADALLFQAISFTNQDIPSYIKGGWILRRAWKIYEKVRKDILALHNKSNSSNSVTTSDQHMNNVIDGNDNVLSPLIVDRLLGSVNFGYGSFQLVMSIVPPKILKLIEFLGFEGDRDAGLSALDYTSKSRDMKGPLAMLGLLWYHTVIRPFFAIDGGNYTAGIPDAEAILERRVDHFSNSSLFQFFKGRIHRLKRENDLSLAIYQNASELAKDQREIQLLCLYEIGWCYLQKLNWTESLKAFIKVRDESRWSKCYYTYLLALCHGSLGDLEMAHALFKDVPGLLKRKNNQIEAFVSRRSEKFKKKAPTQNHIQLLTVEIIFLWHSLPTCSDEELRRLLLVCDAQSDTKLLHLKCLVEGSIHKELGNEELSLQCLEEAVARHQGMKDDHHVPASALYEMSTTLIKHGDPQSLKKARSMLMNVKDNFKDYDFENRLGIRVTNALRQIKALEHAG